MPIRIVEHDSAFGRWLAAQWRPSHLAGLVDTLWYFEGSLTVPRERIFPDGRIELIVHLGPVYRQVTATGTDPFTTCCVSGLMTGPAVIEAPAGEIAVIGMRLWPAGAFALLRRSLPELVNTTVDLRDLLGPASAELAERAAALSGPQAKLHAVASWLQQHCTGTVDPAVAWTASEIQRHAGALSIARLRERTGWSRTRFTETFRQQVGVTPKLLARICRFRRAFQLVHSENSSLARIAIETGYYDQSHFNVEFRELSGFAPGEFLAARRFPQSGTLAEEAR